MGHTQEQKITIPEGSNALAVEVADHGYVSILRHGREIVVDRGGARSHRFVLPPGDYVVRTDGQMGSAKPDKVEIGRSPLDLLRDAATAGSLRLAASVSQRHPVDQVGQLPADGKSSCTVTVEHLDPEGKLAAGMGEEELYLRTTGGTLRDSAGNPTARLRLKAGRGTFTVVAEAVPRFVTVTVFGVLPTLRAELPLEFVPPSELVPRT
ncbi:MAG TPA: hypothetical protein VH877_18380 [Polyangia bacterium]|jgi:hypothetical protein|nr:hypothetical protein [Polyangia bacterium]